MIALAIGCLVGDRSAVAAPPADPAGSSAESAPPDLDDTSTDDVPDAAELDGETESDTETETETDPETDSESARDATADDAATPLSADAAASPAPDSAPPPEGSGEVRSILPGVDCGVRDTQDPLFPVLKALATLRVGGFEIADCRQQRTTLQGIRLEISLLGAEHDLLLYVLEGLAAEGYLIDLAPTGVDELRMTARASAAGGAVEYVRVVDVDLGGDILPADRGRLERVLDVTDANFYPSLKESRARELGYRAEFVPRGPGSMTIQLAAGRSIRRVRVHGQVPLTEREIHRQLSAHAQPGAFARGVCVTPRELRRASSPPAICDRRDIACREWEADEVERLQGYLFDAGYFEGTARLALVCGRKADEADLHIFLAKGRGYHIHRNKIEIEGAPLQDHRWIRREFIPRSLAFFSARVTRDFMDEAIEAVERAYAEPSAGRRRLWGGSRVGTAYPEVRVTTSFDDITRESPPRSRRMPLVVTVDRGHGVRSKFLRAHTPTNPPAQPAGSTRTGGPSDAPDDRQARKRRRDEETSFDPNKLDEQLQIYARREPAGEAVARREAGNVRAYYQDRGHLLADVEGDSRDFGSFDEMAFTVREGPKVRIEGIELREPNGVPPRVVDRVDNAWRDVRKLRKNGAFSERAAREDLGVILGAFNDAGYLCATATVAIAFWEDGLDEAGAHATLGLGELVGGDGHPRWLAQFDARGLARLRAQERAPLHVRIEVHPGPRVVSARTEVVRYLAEPIGLERKVANVPLRETGNWGPRRMLRGGPLRRDDDTPGGLPLATETARQTRRAIIDLYRDNGYPVADADVSWRYRAKSGAVVDVAEITELLDERHGMCREAAEEDAVALEPILSVYEGKKGSFGDVLVRGNFKTKDSVLLRELDFERGAPYSRGKVNRAAKAIDSLGVATTVHIQDYPVGCDFSETQECRVHHVLTIEEAKDLSVDLEFGAGAATLDPLYVWAAPKFPNIFGTAWDFDTEGRWGFDLSNALADSELCDGQSCYERSVQGALRRKRIFGTLADSDITGRYQVRATPARGEVSSAVASWQLSWQLTDTVRVYGGYLFQWANISKDLVKPLGGSNAPWVNRSAAIVTDLTGLVDTGLVWAKVDQIMNPHHGFIATVDLKLASPYLGGYDWWGRVDLAWQHFIPIRGTRERLGVRYSLRYGQLFPFAGPGAETTTVPEVWRYYGGGTAELGIRGIVPETMLVDIEEIDLPYGGKLQRPRAQGGHVRALGTVALQFVSVKRFLGGQLAHSLFYDFGILTQFWKQVDLAQDYRHSVGLNFIKWDIRIVTMAIGYAILVPTKNNIKPTDDPNGRFVFNVGVTF